MKLTTTTTGIFLFASLLIISVFGDLPSCSRARCSHCEADLIARLCPQACISCPRSPLSAASFPPKATAIGTFSNNKPVVHGQPNVGGGGHGELHPLPQAAPSPQPQPLYQQQVQQPPQNQFQQPYYPQQPATFNYPQQPQQPQYAQQQQPQQPQQNFQGFQPQQAYQPAQYAQQQPQTPFFNPFQPFLHQTYQQAAQNGQYNPFNPFPTFAPPSVTFAPPIVTPLPVSSAIPPRAPLPLVPPPPPQLPTFGSQQQQPQIYKAQPPQTQQQRIEGGSSQISTNYQHQQQPHQPQVQAYRPQPQIPQTTSSHGGTHPKPKQIYNNQKVKSLPYPQPAQQPYPQTPQVPQQPYPTVTVAPQAPIYPIPQPAVAASIDSTSISAAGASSDKTTTCPRANFEPCISKELANERFRNCCQRLGDGCAQICSYDQTLANIQIAVLTGRCPISKVADMMVCASGYEDASVCCQAYGVFEPGFEQCRPYCNPAAGLPNDGMLAEKYRCLGKMNQIQQCFYVSQRP